MKHPAIADNSKSFSASSSRLTFNPYRFSEIRLYLNNFLDKAFRMGPPDKTDRWVEGLLLFVYFLYLSPLLYHLSWYSPNPDFFQHATFHENFLHGVKEFGQFPWRSYLLGGGAPILGTPNDPSFDPLILISLLVGSIRGLKLMVMVTLLTSVWATYRLCREMFQVPPIGAFFAALVVGCMGWIPSQLDDGNYKFVTAFWAPLTLLYLHRAENNRRYLFLAAFSLVPPAVRGGLMLFTSVIFIGVFRIAHGLPSGKVILRNLLCLLAVGLLLTGLALPKIIAELDLDQRNEGHVRFEGEHDYKQVTEKIIAHGTSYAPNRFLQFLIKDNEETRSKQNLYMYLGVLPLLLFLAGVLTVPGTGKAAGIAGVLLAWMAMGPTAPLDIYYPLWELIPPFHYFWKLPKYFAPFIGMSIAMGAGIFALFHQRRRTLGFRLALATVYSISLVNLVLHNQPRLGDIYTEKPFTVDANSEYFQVTFANLPKHRSLDIQSLTGIKQYTERQQYFQLLSKVGTINWATQMIIDPPVIPKYYAKTSEDILYPIQPFSEMQANPAYKGEAWFIEGDSEAKLMTISPNRITVHVRCETPGTLVLNQMYDSHFQASNGRVVDVNGLLGVECTRKGQYTVELKLVRHDLLAAMGLSLLIFLSAIFYSILSWVRSWRRS